MSIREDVARFADKIYYSDTYEDENGDFYRHVILPQELLKYLPKERLLEEHECRSLGIIQSKGWRNYMIHKPEPHIILFKKSAHSK